MLYVANLARQGIRLVIKIIDYGLNFQYYPNAHAVGLVERQLVQQREHPREPKRPLGRETDGSSLR